MKDIRAKDVKVVIKDKILSRKEKYFDIITKHQDKHKAIIIRLVDSRKIDESVEAASTIYMNNKVKETTALLGDIVDIKYIVVDVSIYETLNEILYILREYSKDSYVIVQKPLPEYVEKMLNGVEITDLITTPNYDIDCVTKSNFGDFMLNPLKDLEFMPCTVAAIKDIISYKLSNITNDGKTIYNCGNGKVATIIGRSNIVGKPGEALLKAMGYTTVSIHSKTTDIMKSSLLSASDLIVTASGVKNVIDTHMFNHEDLYNPETEMDFIDVGINRNEDGTICGDIPKEFYDYIISDKCTYTPVPGGVGPLTVMNFVNNLLTLIINNSK